MQLGRQSNACSACHIGRLLARVAHPVLQCRDSAVSQPLVRNQRAKVLLKQVGDAVRCPWIIIFM
ncbi:protein of unknown function [Burkholderia multivorans]